MRSKGITSQQEVSDADLLRRLQRGDADAFDALFERHRRGLRAYLVAMTRDVALAEDLLQECFLALVRSVQRLTPRRGASGWLYRVARNKAVDAMRRAPDVPMDPAIVAGIRDAAEQAVGADEIAMSRERRAVLADAVRGLPPAERDVLLLHFWGGLKFREIAAVVRRPLGTVLWRARRGIARLREGCNA
jgi:RNA polymerase sigma factor (sigma-70 family)